MYAHLVHNQLFPWRICTDHVSVPSLCLCSHKLFNCSYNALLCTLAMYGLCHMRMHVLVIIPALSYDFDSLQF